MSMHISPRHPERQKRARRRNRMRNWTAVVLFLIMAVVVGGSIAVYASSGQDRTCTVESKERTTHVRDGASTQQKIVYTKECGVLSVDDVWFQFKFNSADTYGKLQEGQKYEMHTLGFRNGFFSWYPNIVSVEKVSN